MEFMMPWSSEGVLCRSIHEKTMGKRESGKRGRKIRQDLLFNLITRIKLTLLNRFALC